MIRSAAVMLLLVACSLPASRDGHAADAVRLAEAGEETRAFSTTVSLEVDGKLVTRALGEKTNALDLEVRARHEFRARRLPPAGRDARALREVRHYDAAEARVVVAKNTSTSSLGDGRRTFVADGTRAGVRLHAPDFALSSRELDLLDVPGDILSILAILPGDERKVGDEWSAPTWAVQMLGSLEAIEKGELKSTLKSVEDGIARVEFSGTLSGGDEGAAVKLTFDGHYLFDTANAFVSHIELAQRDERTIGPVNPGINVTAKVTVDRKTTENDRYVSPGYARGIPLEAPPESMLIVHALPWNAELLLDRTWHVFHQTKQAALLRCVRNGSLVAQCNVTRVAAAAPGKHTDETKFRDDIVRSLGDSLDRIANSEGVDVGDERFVHRVTAVGENVLESTEGTKTIPMTWVYYLVADPSGRQLSFVFIVESELAKQLGGADEAVVRASRFVEPRLPTRAATRER